MAKAKLHTWKVIVTRNITESTTVTVEAANQREAQDKATEIAVHKHDQNWQVDDGSEGDAYTNGAELVETGKERKA